MTFPAKDNISSVFFLQILAQLGIRSPPRFATTQSWKVYRVAILADKWRMEEEDESRGQLVF
jgi:hypothetical protein